jgi:hypothetical protein
MATSLVMTTSRKHIAAAIASALAVTAITSPSFAQTSELHISAARTAAIRECNARAEKYQQYTWGNVELYYRACMAEHHQVE